MASRLKESFSLGGLLKSARNRAVNGSANIRRGITMDPLFEGRRRIRDATARIGCSIAIGKKHLRAIAELKSKGLLVPTVPKGRTYKFAISPILYRFIIERFCKLNLTRATLN